MRHQYQFAKVIFTYSRKTVFLEELVVPGYCVLGVNVRASHAPLLAANPVSAPLMSSLVVGIQDQELTKQRIGTCELIKWSAQV